MARTTLPYRKLLATAAAVAAATAVATGSTASAAPTWAPASTATIHPGVQLLTDGSQCTANFIYSDGTNVYIGQAAHCSGTDGNTATNGCTSHSLPIGTPVDIDGASRPGTLVYNSWLTMQSLGEKDANTCQYNDLALVQIDAADVANVNPSVPSFGGPVALNTTGTANGEEVSSYGNSSLRLGLSPLSPKTGISLGDSNGGGEQTGYPGNPGRPRGAGGGLPGHPGP